MGLIEKLQVLKMLDEMKARLNQNMQETEVVFLEILKNKINGMKGTKAKEGWILCNERLPDKGDEYYPVCIVTLDDGDVCVGVYRDDDCVWYTRKLVGEKIYSTNRNVIAWQLFPEPYKPTTPADRNPHLMTSFMRVV